MAEYTDRALLDISDVLKKADIMEERLKKAVAIRTGAVEVPTLRIPGGSGRQLSELDAKVKALGQTVKSTRNAWQTQVLTDEETADSARKLRDELLKLATAEDANIDTVLRATNAAAQAQRTMDQARGDVTKGGFAFNASSGIIDALSSLGGPAGAAAGMVGQWVMQGLTNSMEAGRPKVKAEAVEVSDDIVEALKKRLKIQSPSVVMEQIGQWIMEGLVRGFRSGHDDVMAEVRRTANEIPEQFSGVSGGGVGGVGLPVAPDTTTKAKEAADAAKGAGDAVETAGDQAAEAGNNMDVLTGFLAAGAVAATAFTAAIAVSIPQAEEFQKHLAAIATESDLTKEQLTALGDGLLEMAPKVGQSAKLLAQASYDVVGAGVKGADTIDKINGLTEISAKAASAGLTEVKTSADVITSALNAYGLSVENAQHVSDVFFKTTATGKITFSQIAGSMGELFPKAKTLGVSLEELSASAAALTASGVPVEQAMTGIGAAFDNVIKPSEEAKDLSKELGLGFSAAALQSKGWSNFLDEIVVKTGGNVELLGRLFGSTEAVNAIFALTGTDGGPRFAKALEEIRHSAGATDEAFRKQAETAAFARQQWLAAVEAMQIEFGTRFLPIFTKTLKALTDVIVKLDELGENSTVQFALVVAGAGLAATAVLKLSTALKTAAASSALLQGVTAAGGWKAFLTGTAAANTGVLKFLGNTSKIMPKLNGLNTGLVNVVSKLGVFGQAGLVAGAAFGGWKIGEWINNLKLFGDKTTTVADKLQDFFAVRLFGADPKLIQEARDAEEAQQRKAASTEKATEATIDNGAAEREAAEAARRAAEQRAAELEKIRQQTLALRELNKELGDRKLRLSLDGKPEFMRELSSLGQEFDEMLTKFKAPFYLPSGKLDTGSEKYQEGRAALDEQREKETSAVITRELERQADERIRLEREVQSTKLSLIQDETAKRRAELAQQVDDVQKAFQKQIDIARASANVKGLSNEQRAGFLREATRLEGLQAEQVKGVREKAAQDLVKIEEDRMRRVQSALQGELNAQVKVSAAAVSVLEQQRERELTMAGDAPAARLAVEERYGGQILRLQQQQIAVSGQAQRAQLLQNLDQQLRDAESGGARRAEMERAARATYLSELSALELSEQRETDARKLAAERRVQEQRLAIFKEALDRRMQGIREATGQEIAALEQVLQAERAKAQAGGDQGRVSAIDNALKDITDLKVENLASFKTALREAGKEAGDLRQTLREVNDTPLESAVRSATSAVDGAIAAARDQLAAIRKAFGKVAEPTEGQRTMFEAREAELTAIISTATAQRVKVKLEAEQKYNREVRASALDRAEAETRLAEKLAQTDSDLAAVRQQAMGNLMARMRDVDNRLPVAKDETEKNNLVVERLNLYGQILDLQDQINQKELEREQQRLGVLKAERAERLELSGLAGNQVATGDAALTEAREALGLAQERLRVARTSAQYDEAVVAHANAVTAVSQAQRAVTQARLAEEDRVIAGVKEEVRARAEISGLAADAVASKQLELALIQMDARENARRLADARDLLLTDEQIAALRSEQVRLQVEEVKQRRELARAQMDVQRAQLDFTEAATRSALARSRFADDQVALARVDLAVTRERLRLTDEEIAQSAELGLNASEVLGLQRERLGLLGEEARGVEQLAKAERARLELARALRDALNDLQVEARDRREGSALVQATDDLASAASKLSEAEADVQPLLGRLGESLTWQEAEEGKTRVEALTSAIGEYRSRLEGLASVYEEQVNGIEAVIDAAVRLTDVYREGLSGPDASRADRLKVEQADLFGLSVIEQQRQNAIADTTRVLGDQSATYTQVATAANRLAQAETDRAAALTERIQVLGQRVAKGGDANELISLLTKAGYTAGQVGTMLTKLRQGQKDVLKDVRARISQEGVAQLEALQQRALKSLQDVDQLRIQAFKARTEAARQFEEYARLGSAVRIADAGFNELEATQLAAITRQNELQQLLEKTSATDPAGISKRDAQRAMREENDALVRQAQLRTGIQDAVKVTQQDVNLQREINRQVTLELERQRSTLEAGLLPAGAKTQLTEESARALADENEQLAEQATLRKGLDSSKDVTKRDIEEQRAINAEVEKFNALQKSRVAGLRATGGKRPYNAANPEVQATVLLDQAREDALLDNEARRKRLIAFEIEKATAVAKALAGDPGVLAAEVKKHEALLSAVLPLQQRFDQERAQAAARSMQEAAQALKMPDLTAQAGETGARAGQAFATAFLQVAQEALRRPIDLQVRPALSAGVPAGGNQITHNSTIINTFYVNGQKYPSLPEIQRIAADAGRQVIRELVDKRRRSGTAC